MGARKRMQSKDRKAQKQAAAAVLLGGGGGGASSKRRLQYGLALGGLVLAVVLCVLSSSSLMRLEPGRRAPAAGAAARAGKGIGGRSSSSGGGGAGVRASSWVQGGWRGLKGLGLGVMDALGFAGEEPAETRRRRQVLEGMRFNGAPPLPGYPDDQQKHGATAEARRQWAEEETAALAAMARRPVMRFNGREPDCLAAEACPGPSTAQRLARARGVGAGLGGGGGGSGGLL